MSNNNILVIGIAGGTGSGKSTLTKQLVNHFGDQITVLKHDDYYKAHDEMTYEERTHLNYDHPNAFDTDLMLQHLRQLKNGEPINYIDPETNKVVSIDVRAEKEKVIAQMAEKFIKMLNSDYGDLLDIRYILMAGGTGEAYYPFIKEYCEKYRPYIKVVLAGEDMKMGEDNIGPVNAIVCGLFKGVIINEAA